MTGWLLFAAVRRAPRRLALAALGIAFPVAMLASTLLFVDAAVRGMTRVALEPVQVEQRALATSLDVDMSAVARQLATAPGVRRVERFAAADVILGSPGRIGKATARLIAVDPAYIRHHPWVRLTSGSPGPGAFLNEALHVKPAFNSARSVTIELPGGSRTLATLPVRGIVDLRKASTWFAIPTGAVQGDVTVVPRAIVIDYATFERSLLPALRTKLGTTTPVLNPGLTDLPPVDLEAHVSVDHSAYPSDPAAAAGWSTTLQHVLERRVPGQVVLADDAVEALTLAEADATNAKILFLLLGIPGVLVAAGLGLAAESTLAEAHRREEALLRLRGATEGQLARLAAAHAALAGLVGAAVGVLAAGALVSGVEGRAVWSLVSASRLAISVGLALLTGLALVGLRVFRLLRAGKRSQVAAERGLLERGWAPAWLRARLDLAAIGAGVAILLVNLLTGGLRQTPIEGSSLALSFYVLLAPIALWIGLSLLATRGLLAGFGRWARPERARPLTSWRQALLRWLGRRPARTAVVLVLGTLAVAFGTEVVAFVSTYRAAKRADAQAAFGSDVRFTPSTEVAQQLPRLGPSVEATTPVWTVPTRVGSDRKTILAVDPATYAQAITTTPRLLAGRGIEALAGKRFDVLVSPEIRIDFAVGPGDTLPMTIYPDDEEKSRNVNLHVVGVFRSVPPTDPPTELVASAAQLPPWLLGPPEFYLGRIAPGNSPGSVARALQHGSAGRAFRITTLHGAARLGPRSLTTLNLGGLGRIEAAGAALIAAIGVAVLGAFIVLERRREFAVLRSIGAETPRVLAGPAQEGAIAVLGSLLVGIPLGLGLGVLSVRVLGLFFDLPPPLLAFPAAPLGLFVLVLVAASAVALAGALVAVSRLPVAAVLREP